MDAKPTDEKLTFPIIRDRCPNCACKETIASKMARELGLPITPQTGIININTMFPHPIVHAPVVPAVLSTLDICVDCGTVYCRYVTMGIAQPPQMKKP